MALSDDAPNIQRPPNDNIPNFAERAMLSVAATATNLRLDQTRHQRVLRKFSMRDICRFMGYSQTSTLRKLLEHPDAPAPLDSGRERHLSIADMMKLRVLSARPGGPHRVSKLFWRRPGDPLPVITFSSQKGGSGKSISAAHLAQGAVLFHGLRVGIIDADPQATASLYFADDTLDVAGLNVNTFTTFMGVPSAGEPPLKHSEADLDAFWKRTPWPGLRIIPGGATIQEADIAMYFMTRSQDTENRRVYRLLRDTIDRWSRAYPPRSSAGDLFDGAGRLDPEAYDTALHETLDLIIIDSAPSLSLAQLNAVVAGSTLIAPSAMRGFDLSTLQIYLSSLSDYFSFIRSETDPVIFPPAPSYVLPTIVSPNSDTDMRQIGELYSHDPEVVCPVFFTRSEAVANAAREYQSIYEYDPPRSRRQSAADFTFNANAVVDAILSRTVPWIEPRGYANAFIRNTYPPGTVPLWTKDVGLLEDVS